MKKRVKIKDKLRYLKIKDKKKFLFDLSILIIIVFIGVFLAIKFWDSFKSIDSLKSSINGAGAVGPILVIALIMLEVVIAPIPGYFIAIASGYVFGWFLGTIYSYIGNILGASLAFYLSRRFGRPLIKRLVDEKKLGSYDKFIKKEGKLGLWLVYLFPIFPVDIVSFGVGLSNMKFKEFAPIILIAFISNMLLLNHFGESLSRLNTKSGLIFMGVTVTFLLFFALFVYHKLRRDINEK
jgi:uncharacterized membrane protein YdjX (TVP38/TMEM64 family)